MAKAEKGSAKRGRPAKAAPAEAVVVVPAKSPSSDAVVGFEQKMKRLVATLDEQFKEAADAMRYAKPALTVVQRVQLLQGTRARSTPAEIA